jgi:hypothetical protein
MSVFEQLQTRREQGTNDPTRRRKETEEQTEDRAGACAGYDRRQRKINQRPKLVKLQSKE